MYVIEKFTNNLHAMNYNKIFELIKISEPHVILNPQRLDKESESVNLSSNFGLVAGILSSLAITALAALFILRRRNLYKRSSNGSAYSDDSDVRFLTSDEVLDFGLAKPADDD